MDIKATIASGYRWRLIIIAAGCLFWASWCVKDATVTYPDQIERRAYFLDYKEKNTNWNVTWPEEARSKGWPTEEPVERSNGDILTQWLMFGLTAPIGLYCLAMVALWQRRFVAADEKALYAQGGRAAKWDEITEVDAVRWKSKGIAKVAYENNAGSGTIVLDDWKFEREPTVEIFRKLREQVDEDKFVGYEGDTNTLADDEPTDENGGDHTDAASSEAESSEQVKPVSGA